jgi:hypothetical protein
MRGKASAVLSPIHINETDAPVEEVSGTSEGESTAAMSEATLINEAIPQLAKCTAGLCANRYE